MTISTATVAVGVIGVGRIGRMHASLLAREIPGATLAAVHDANPEATEAIGVRACGLDELLADPGVDAVAICSSTETHADLVVVAAQAGKAIFCEKPISLDRATTVSTIEAVERAGVPFQVGFHRRFDPDWVAAAERIHAGELGRVTLFRTSLRDMTPPNPAFIAGSGGFFRDVTVHDLDVARWLVGEVVEVTAHGAAADPAFADVGDIDTAVVVLRFAGGALGDEGARILASSPHLSSLLSLDLGSNTITDDGALALAASGGLAGLTALCLSNNQIGEGAFAALRQWKLGEWARFTIARNPMSHDRRLELTLASVSRQ